MRVQWLVAEALVDRVIRRSDRVWRKGVALNAEERAEVSLATTKAKVLAHRVASFVAQGSFEVADVRSTKVVPVLDHFWYNARTHTLHNLLGYKLCTIGCYALEGIPSDVTIHGRTPIDLRIPLLTHDYGGRYNVKFVYYHAFTLCPAPLLPPLSPRTLLPSTQPASTFVAYPTRRLAQRLPAWAVYPVRLTRVSSPSAKRDSCMTTCSSSMMSDSRRRCRWPSVAVSACSRCIY